MRLRTVLSGNKILLSCLVSLCLQMTNVQVGECDLDINYLLWIYSSLATLAVYKAVYEKEKLELYKKKNCICMFTCIYVF